MLHLIALAVAAQVAPPGEFSEEPRLVGAVTASFPKAFTTGWQGATRIYSLAEPNESYVVHLSPPTPASEPRYKNLTVILVGASDARVARFQQAGKPASNLGPNETMPDTVTYTASLDMMTVEAVEHAVDTALCLAHENFRPARPHIYFDCPIICIRDDIPDANDVVACVSCPMPGTPGAQLHDLGKLLVEYAEAPTSDRARKLRAEAASVAKSISERATPHPPSPAKTRP